MGALGSLYPDAKALFVPTDAVIATGVDWLGWRASGPCQVNAVYAVNAATVATVTNTMALTVNKRPGGTGAAVAIASQAAGVGFTAATPVTLTMTATVANTKLAAGDWVSVTKTLAGTGVSTGLVVILEIVDGYKN
jgi:glycine cleavage system pyridoxal-binding protein P